MYYSETGKHIFAISVLNMLKPIKDCEYKCKASGNGMSVTV